MKQARETEPPLLPDGVGLDFTLDPATLPALEAYLPIGLFTLAPNGAVIGWNAGAERISGIPREEMMGADLSLLDPSKGKGLGQLVADLHEHLGEDSEPLERVCRVMHPDSRELYVLASLQVLRGADGAIAGSVGTLTDLTPHYRAGRVGTRASLARTRRAPQRMIGDSPPMQSVIRQVGLAARSDVTVLITGPSGTGKELAASAIHALSKRRERPFISVNCSAIPETLLESELFGHVRGAFTGAIRDKVGLFQAAQGGTLFLDEVGDLSKLMQVKLLRALQEREIRRVGDEHSIAFDARIISATNRNLVDLVNSGDYREDFFYRIRVFEIQIPSLRNRVEDISLLIEHFVGELSEQHDKPVVGVTDQALQALLAYGWPGNIRQLRNALEHAFVTVEDARIRLEDLPPEILARIDPFDPPLATARSLLPLDRERVLTALRDSGGRRAQAARALGVSRVTLWKKIRMFGIDPDAAPPPQEEDEPA